MLNLFSKLESPDPLWKRRLWIAGLVLAAVLRIVLIERHGLWNNEFITLGVIKLSYGEILAERLAKNHTPLYFLMEKGWTDLFGYSEWSMRVIAAFFGWMAVWATARLARRIGGYRLAIPVLYSAAIHQIWMDASLEARMYSMLTWVVAESADAYLASTRSHALGGAPGGPAIGALTRWSAVCTVGFYTHMLFASVCTLHGLDAVVTRLRRRVSIGGFPVALAVVALLSAPIVLGWMTHQDKFAAAVEWDWKGPDILIRQTCRLLWGNYDSLDSYILRAAGYLLFAASLLGVLLGLRSLRLGAQSTPDAGSCPDGSLDQARKWRDIRMLLSWFALYMAGLSIAAARTTAPVLGSERYYFPIAPFIVILGWAGILNLFSRARRLRAATGFLALALQASYLVAYFVGPGEGLREAVAHIEADFPENRGLVCVMSNSAESALGAYYGQRLPKDFFRVSRHIRDPEEIANLIRPYAEGQPEFWVLTYHEKKSGIWKMLRRRAEEYEPLTGRQVFGETETQLFRRIP